MSNKTSILLIEDNARQRRTLFDILKVKGFEVFVAENGAEGLALLKEKPVNLVLTDLGLPDISGIDILREVKAVSPGIQVIILTGSATFDSAVEATNLGAFSYQLKPYDIDQLLMHIQRAIEKQRVDEELRISRQMLDDVTQGITESILLISMDYKILWANKTAIDQAGLPMDQIVGNSFSATIHHHRESAGEPPDEPSPLREFIATGNSRTVQRRHDKDGNETVVEVNVYPAKDKAGDITGFIYVSRDITERDRLEKEIADRVVQLEASLTRVRQLEGILPICVYCKKIRDDKDTWRRMEEFISSHSEADFSHGVCPECFTKEMDEIDKE